MFSIPSFKEIITMSKEKFDESMLSLRMRGAKARADMELISYEEKLVTIETTIKELCAKKDLDFTAIIKELDAFDVATRRKAQIEHVVKSLFPDNPEGK